MLRRYRRSLLLAPVLAAVIGVVVGLGVYLGGNPQVRDEGGVGAFVSLVVPAALLTLATGVLAVLGGAVALLVRDRRLLLPTRRRVAAIVIGASVASFLGWFAVGVASWTAGPAFGVAFGVIAAIVAAVVSFVLVDADERRAAAAAAA